MTKFNKTWKIGDKVKLFSQFTKEVFTIIEIHESGLWVKLHGIDGSFERKDVIKLYS